MVTGKSFRLYDFKTYDSATSREDGSDEDGGEDAASAPRIFIVQCFGINELGETCSISVQDFKPFFFVKVGATWTQTNVDILLRELRAKMGTFFAPQLKTAELASYHSLYGFSAGSKDKFAKLTFASTSAMAKARGLWNKYHPVTGVRSCVVIRSQGIALDTYEGALLPLLRYFHITGISPSGWVLIDSSRAIEPDVRRTTCDFEFECDSAGVIPLPDKETQVPYKICSFDIEASSSDGDFPMPVKDYRRLAMQMVDGLARQPRASDPKWIADTLPRVIRASFGRGRFDDIDAVHPKRAPSESELTSLIERLLSAPIEVMRAGDNANVAGIAEMFSAMAASASITAKDDDADEEYDADAPPPPPRKAAAVSGTVVELLCSSKHDRESKIKLINESLTGAFPALEGDRITFIGSTFLRCGDPDPYLNHCLALPGCGAVAGSTIEIVPTETAMLERWAELMRDERPNIIVGYNIFGFDYEFMFQRAKQLKCERPFLRLSPNIDETAGVEDRKTGELSLACTQVRLAAGEFNLYYPLISGILQIDLLAYFRRDDTSLSSYKLDDVAGHYISDHIHRVEHIAEGCATELYTGNISGLRVGDYIHIEITGFTSDYFDDGRKFEVAALRKDDATGHNVIRLTCRAELQEMKKLKWCMTKDDVSVKDIFRLAEGTAPERARVAKYCIQDCNLVHHLMAKSDVLTGFVEMSRICSVPMSFLVQRGQGIKLTSFVAKKCREKQTLMPDLKKSMGNEGFEGAIVLPPKCALYMDNPVACVDYSSLYPSSMISQNYSHDSKVWTRELDLAGALVRETGEKLADGSFRYDNLPGYSYIDVQFDTFAYIAKNPAARAEKVKVGTKTCRWAQLPEGQRSIMPTILEELLCARADARKKSKTEPDPFMKNVLDKRQLGYKVTANSLYGQCGAKTSTFYDLDVAASTTATGRAMIMYAKRVVEEVYGDLEYATAAHGLVRTRAEYIYGDTDSVFFTFNLQDVATGENIVGQKALEITIEIAQDAARLCSQFLKAPMDLAYEKTLMPFILLSKKRYVGMLYEQDANRGKLKYMGLSLKRRDSCDYLKDVYGGILNILMQDSDIRKAVAFLNSSLTELAAGNVPMDKLVITKALRGYYKNPAQIAHAVLATRIGQRDAGNKPKPGDRLKFVHIAIANKKALQGEKIETPEFITENRVPIDYAFYITNQLMKPLQQLFGLALHKIWESQGKVLAMRAHARELAELEKESDGLELFMKRKEKLCSAKIKVLLFDSWLAKIAGAQSGTKPITSFFAASA
jgi:DNA polymerase elongation subunit (family B)